MNHAYEYQDVDRQALVRLMLWPPDARKRFLLLVEQSGWQNGDGPIPGVWNHKKPGQRCLWSCAWIFLGSGRVHPDQILPVTACTDAQLYAELRDIADRGDEAAKDAIAQGGFDRTLAEKIVAGARKQYRDYLWPFNNSPAQQKKLTARPGWK